MKTDMDFRGSGLRRGVRNDKFVGFRYGQDLENRAAHPHQEFPGVPPVVCFTLLYFPNKKSKKLKTILS